MNSDDKLIQSARATLKAMRQAMSNEERSALLLSRSYQQQVVLTTTAAPAQNTQFDLGFWEGFGTGSPPVWAGQTIANRNQAFSGRYTTNANFGTWVKSRPMFLINMYARPATNATLASSLALAQAKLSDDGDLIPSTRTRNFDLRQDFQTLPTQWPAEGFVLSGDKWVTLLTQGMTNAAGDAITAILTLVPCEDILSLVSRRPNALKYTS